ncbi:hypothetical protein DRO69_03265 [Candidatus Bathyarchaeota archaeon]|nr:MAG: hypothetical protein DRO69_03265 [Candidatus Bathyarchaeota archaeon]
MNQRFAFVIFGSFYFFVLLGSYLLGFLYPFFTFYGWFLIPVVANFFVGYLVIEVDASIKIIFACLSLNVGIVFGWLSVSTGYDAFLSIPLLASYYTLHMVLGITISLIGTAVREYGNYIIDMSVCLVKKIKQIIEKRSSKG